MGGGVGFFFFFFNDTATTEIYTLSLHDALPISEIDLTGSKLTTALSRSLAITEDRAEALKIQHGLVASGATNFRQTLGPFIDGLVGEIRSNFSVHAQRSGGGSVTKLLVSGGAARLQGFTAYLDEHFGIAVQPLESFANLALPEQLAGKLGAVAPTFAIAAGLALRHRHEQHHRN